MGLHACDRLTSQVIVAGGGPAGFAAALAASRMGASTVLIERLGSPGGLLVGGLVAPMMSFHSAVGQVVQGIAQELAARLQKSGYSPGHVPDPLDFCWSVTPFDPEGLRYTMLEMLEEAGVELYFHSEVISSEVDKGSIRSVTITHAGQQITLSGKVFIDATGDLTLGFLAGAGYYYAEGREIQPQTLMFNLSGVDWNEIMLYFHHHPEEIQHPYALHGTIDAEWLAGLPYKGFSGGMSLVKAAKEDGLSLPRERLVVFQGMADDQAIVNATRVAGFDPLSASDTARAELEGRRQMGDIIRFLRAYFPGFGEARLLKSACFSGVRESRRLKGLYQVSTEDLVNDRVFPDAVACGAYPLDVHLPGTGLKVQRPHSYYTIPYRALLSLSLDNLLAAGRCISATQDALGALRVSPLAMATGEAAGTAAALSLRMGVSPCELDAAKLRQTLAANGCSTGC